MTRGQGGFTRVCDSCHFLGRWRSAAHECMGPYGTRRRTRTFSPRCEGLSGAARDGGFLFRARQNLSRRIPRSHRVLLRAPVHSRSVPGLHVFAVTPHARGSNLRPRVGRRPKILHGHDQQRVARIERVSHRKVWFAGHLPRICEFLFRRLAQTRKRHLPDGNRAYTDRPTRLLLYRRSLAEPGVCRETWNAHHPDADSRAIERRFGKAERASVSLRRRKQTTRWREAATNLNPLNFPASRTMWRSTNSRRIT